MKAVFLAGNEAIIAAQNEAYAREKAETKKYMKRYAFMQFIIRRQIRCGKVFVFPLLVAVFVAAFFSFHMWYVQTGKDVPSGYIFTAIFFFAVLAVAWCAAHDAKTVAIRTMLELEKTPQSEWFTVSGVEQNQDTTYPLKLTLVDPFGKVSTIKVNSDLDEMTEDSEFDVMKVFIVHCLKAKWEPIANVIRKQKRYQEE